MNRALELHDSTIASINVSEASIIIKLRPAYIHESGGMPGINAGSGYVQDLDITFSQARLTKSPTTLPADISDGSLSTGNIEEKNVVPLPLNVRGTISFRLVTENNEELCIDAAFAESKSIGDARLVEKFPGPSV